MGRIILLDPKAMRNALQVKNKLTLVDGLMEKLEKGTLEYEVWPCNAIAVAWMSNSLMKRLNKSIAYPYGSENIMRQSEGVFLPR